MCPKVTAVRRNHSDIVGQLLRLHSKGYKSSHSVAVAIATLEETKKTFDYLFYHSDNFSLEERRTRTFSYLLSTQTFIHRYKGEKVNYSHCLQDFHDM